MKFEGAESELSLLLKKNIMHGQKFSCEKLMSTIIIRQLKSLKFQHRELSSTCFFKHIDWLYSFIPYLLERGEKGSKKCASHNSIETR